MGKVTDFLRKIGVLQVSKGDSATGEFDNREDLKTKEEMPKSEAAEVTDETKTEE